MRLTIVTNGNRFAALALRPVLRSWDPDQVQVWVTTGLRKQSGSRAREAVDLARRWGLRYLTFKVTVNLVPQVAQRVLRRPLTVAGLCAERGIPVLSARNVNQSDPRARIEAFAPDVLLSFSCPYRIGPALLAVPRVGSLNVHSSLLPAYAGVCTYVHVLADGAERTGITVHEMVERFDAGRIVAQREVPIAGPTSAFALFSTQCAIAGELLVDALAAIERTGRIDGQDQDEAGRSYFGEPTRSDVARLRGAGHRLLALRDVPRTWSARASSSS